jgi:hypothetical protein
MALIGAIRAHPLWFLFGLAAVSLIGLLFVPPIPQPQSYHRFADERTLFGIPNFWNVVSNIPFVLVGALGLKYLRRDLSAGVFFLGVFLTGFSSSYYHWSPNDAGLFWDRLPMTFAFTAILANQIVERIDAQVGRALLWPLVALGVVSLYVWVLYDDLRLYGWVQFFPCVALPLMFALFAPKYTGTLYWIAAAGFYILAKVLEHYDKAIDTALRVISGHPLKHVAAACACAAILWAFETRRPISDAEAISAAHRP